MKSIKLKWSWLDFIFFLILILLFMVIYVINTKALLPNLHSDIVAEMNYTEEVVKQRTLFPVGWKNSQELFILRPIFISAPIYAFTGDFVGSYQITLIIMTVLLALSVAFALYKYEVSLTASLLTLCVLFGLFTGYEENVMWTFLYSYSVFPVVIFLSLGLLKDLYLESIEAKKVCKYLFLIALAFYMGMGGPRMTLVFYIPILITSILMEIHLMKSINIKWNQKIFPCSILLISNIMGFLFLKIYLAEAIGFSDLTSYMILGIKEIFTNIISQISAIFMMLGVRGGISLLSIAGIEFIIRLISIFLVITIAIYLLKNKSINKDHKFIIIYMCNSIVFVFLYLLLTVDIPVGRYYFMIIFLFAIIIGIFFSSIKNFHHKIIANIIILFLIVATCFNLSVHGIAKLENNGNEVYYEIINFLESNSYDKIFASYWNASILKGLSNGKIETGHFNQFPTPYLWLIQEDVFYTDEINEKCLVMLSDNEEQIILSSNGKAKSILETGVKIKKIREFNIYVFSYNPITIFRMPEEKGDSVIYDVKSNYAYVNEQCIVKKDASALEMKYNGAVVYGPYININNGAYDFYLDYFIVEDNNDIQEVGEFFITSQNGQKIIAQEKLLSGKNSTLIKNVIFSEDERVEFKIIVYGEHIIDLKTITITRN